MKFNDNASIDVIVGNLKRATDPNTAVTRMQKKDLSDDYLLGRCKYRYLVIVEPGLGNHSLVYTQYNLPVLSILQKEEFAAIAQKKAEGNENIRYIFGNPAEFRDRNRKYDVWQIDTDALEDVKNMPSVLGNALSHSDKVYLTFYPPTEASLSLRKKMHEEEGWRNVRIHGTDIVSDEGILSYSMTRDQVISVARTVDAVRIFTPLGDFGEIAELMKR